MKLQEAIETLKRVVENSNRYFDGLNEGLKNKTFALKRTESNIVTLGIFDGEDLKQFSDFNFRLRVAGCDVSFAYPFRAYDFISNDWECGFDDPYNEVATFESFKDILLDEWDEALLDYYSVLEKSKLLFTKIDGSDIGRIDIFAVFSGKSETLSGMTQAIKDWWIPDTLNEFSKDDLFEIEIAMKNGKSFYLGEFKEDSNV